MDRKELLKQVEATFKSNENAEKLYVTSDGMCFHHEAPARNHSRMLGPHGGVECITRDSLERMASGKPAAGKPKAEENTNAGEGGASTNAGDGRENGGGAAAGEVTAGTDGGQPEQQAAATAKKEAPKKVATKKAATKKSATKKK